MKNIIIKNIVRKECIPVNLLLLADPSEELIRKYINIGDTFGAYFDNEIVGVYILIHTKKETVELINIAVDEKFQGKGIGKTMILDAINRAKKMHAKRLEIGTGNSSIYQLNLYQKCGFKIEGIDKNFFKRNYEEKIIENGIECVDMVRLGMEI